jgi:acyl carrier protein
VPVVPDFFANNKKMKKGIFESVKEFTTKQSGIKEDKIKEDASLENDLGIYGDDAVEFIIAFGKEFNVDVSRFMAADYFSGEGIDFINPLIRGLAGQRVPKKKILTIRHLEKAVESGRLDEETINAEN